MVVVGQSGFIWAMWLYSGKVVVFGQSVFNSAKVIVFGQRLLYSSKGDCIQAKVSVFVQNGCIWTKWLYSGKRL